MKVSIIIPTYNGEKTIGKSIESILNQTNDCEKEILICDDCTTDKTLEIAKKYPVIIIENDVNSGGPNKGRNNGIKAATGEYLAFLDQDDEWSLNKLGIQLNINADVVYSMPVGNKMKPILDTLYNILKTRSKKQNWAYLGSLLIKNENVPLFEEYFGQLDYDWLLRLTKHRICVECEPVVIRNVDDNNLSLNPEYRKRDFYMGLLDVDGNTKTMKKWYASRARYHYVVGDMKMARFYFIRGELNWKTILYFISSFNANLSKLIIKKFKVFG